MSLPISILIEKGGYTKNPGDHLHNQNYIIVAYLPLIYSDQDINSRIISILDGQEYGVVTCKQ
jgi:hypothetical protein